MEGKAKKEDCDMSKEMKVELMWNCPYCGTQGILGRYRECPKCGHGRSKDVKFYLPGGGGIGTVVSKEKGHNIVDASTLESKNPDWYCNHCDTYNSDARNTCKNCGAPRYENVKSYADINRNKEDLSDSAKNYHPDGWHCQHCGTRNEKGTTKCWWCGAEKEAPKHPDTEDTMKREKVSRWDVKETHDIPANHWKKKIKLPDFTCKFIKWSIIAGLIVLAIVGLVMLFNQKIDSEVEELRWEYSIEIEEYKHLFENDWDLPANAELAYTQQEFHHLEKKLDYVETKKEEKSKTVTTYSTYQVYVGDDGNGYGTLSTVTKPINSTVTWYEDVEVKHYKDVPVYRTKYYYYIWRWVYSRTEKRRGKSGDNSDPSFPKPTLNDKERLGKKRKIYSMTARIINDKKEEKKEYILSEDVWRTLKVGDKLTVGVFVDEITGIDEKE